MSVLVSSLVWGLALSLLMSALILGIMWVRPRLMLHHYPPSIQAKVPLATEEERRLSKISLGVSLPLVFGLPVLAAVLLGLEPIDAFFHGAGMMLVLGIVDLVIIDWLIFCWLRPSFMVLPGSEGAGGYGDYRHHAIGFARGLPLAAATGLAAALAGVIANG